jgi:hypothetical protein
MLNESPIIPCAIISVMALMTNRKSPSVRTVTGSVRRIKKGFTKMFKTEMSKLAIIAAPTPLI